MTDYIQIITTMDSKNIAQKIADTLVEKKLAACVQISSPIQSTYLWKDDLESSIEYMCMIKTRKDLFDKVEETIINLHNYDVPEILAVPIIMGHKPYIEWLEEELKDTK
jgi:periplasmic divalent cation tolerance protein